MKYSTKTGTLSELRTDVLIASRKTAESTARALGSRELLTAAITDFKDKPGEVLLVNLPAKSGVRRLLIAGGTDGTLSETDFRKALRTTAERLKTLPAKNALWALTLARVTGKDAYWKASTALTALSTALYAFDLHKSKPAETPATTITRVDFHADGRSKSQISRAVRHGQAAKSGLDWARDLGNQPPNICDPGFLLKESRKLAKDPAVTVSALDEKRMTELGMGAFLSVSRGSDKPGKMIIIQYRGAKKAKDAPIVLVGKGITFDTGGISLKPGAAMDEMKFDMCGAASVLGATRAVIEARLPINLVTIVAAAENMPSGRATRPGDIVSTHSGKTVEILNTDAEGRLVLCDALSYAAERFKPKVIIDVATLTGAIIVALGAQASGLFSSDDALAQDLLAAGEFSGDRAWRMPVWEEYQPSLKSPFADVANIGTGGAGSVLAACFLARFVEKQRWAHLDVAGTAFQGGTTKGATGRPVSLLFRYLVDQAGG
ncbi:MAG: leucyl aminopeptidase [Pseudomonadales bacterium]